MAHTFNVDIGKKQIDKQSGRIKESFWVSHRMENYHAPKSKVQSPKFIQCGKPGKGKVRNGLEKKNIMQSVKHGGKNYLVQTPNVEVELLVSLTIRD